jgi:hypothetical protein
MDKDGLTPEEKLQVTHAAGGALLDLLANNPKVLSLAAEDHESVSLIFVAGVGAGADALARVIDLNSDIPL